MPEPTRLTAQAHVLTDNPERYRKQLASHLGRRSEVREESDGTRIVMTVGECLLSAVDGQLDLTATASTQEELDQVTDVVGSHLVRFGQRNELTVTWVTA